MGERYIKFKAFLVMNNIKQREVAELLDLTVSTFSRKINRNHADFTPSEIFMICDHFGISADDFFVQ